MPGASILGISEAQSWLVPALDPNSSFAGSLRLPAALCEPGECPPPPAVLDGLLDFVIDGCPVTPDDENTTITVADASASTTGLAGRLTDVKWSLSGDDDPILSDLIADANAARVPLAPRGGGAYGDDGRGGYGYGYGGGYGGYGGGGAWPL